MFYPLIRNILFAFDAEDVHYLAMNNFKLGCAMPGIGGIIRSSFKYNHPSLHKTVFGLNFKNPVGLGAGFDKNALFLNELEALGFGFVEIGTVTPKPQAGNDKPRLFRLKEDKALINRMGFNNDGVEVVARRLRDRGEKQVKSEELRVKSETKSVKRETADVKSEGQNTINQSAIRNLQSPMIIGGNIGKNKVTPNEDAWMDYQICFNGLFDCVDYFVVNVSSPNTPGLRELQEKDSLRKILSQLQNINYGKPAKKPLLLKIAPDLTQGQLDDIASLAFEVNLDGLVATNTTIDRSKLSERSKLKSEGFGAGGLSGLPLRERATEVVTYLHKQTAGKIPIIASGGIFTGNDAQEKLNAGASLVQVWTGFIYEGPAIVKKICRQLVQKN
jgi:dihydroorotate dehydrogenase